MAPSEIALCDTRIYYLKDQELSKIRPTSGSTIIEVGPGKDTSLSTPSTGRVNIRCSSDNQSTHVIIYERGEGKTLTDSSEWFPVPTLQPNTLGLRILVRHVVSPDLKVGIRSKPEDLKPKGINKPHPIL